MMLHPLVPKLRQLKARSVLGFERRAKAGA
jgi:hypothetical protein